MGYFADKSPSNLMEIEHFEHLFRNSKILFRYRDPRDIYVWKELFHHSVLKIRPAPLNGIGDAAYLDSRRSLLADVFALSLKLVATEQRLRGAGYSTHCVLYEDLVRDYERTVGEALRFLGMPVGIPAVRAHLRRCRDEQSDTFRKGGSGDWRNHISSPAARALLRRRYGDQLIQLGYENGIDW